MTEKQCKFQCGNLVKICPSNKNEPIFGIIVEASNSEGKIRYEIISDRIYSKLEKHVSHIDYDIDKELDYAFPMTKRVFPSLVAISIISVQPLPQPKGNIFSL